MSSSVSPATSPTPDELDALTAAVGEVMECSFFALAEPLDWDRYQEARALAGDEWWTITVDFAGPFRGSVLIGLPDGLARQLLESFAGLMPDEGTTAEEVGQMMAELANMVTGAWLTRAHRQEKFDLAAPVARRVAAAELADASATSWFGVNDAPMVLWMRRAAEVAA